MRKCIKACSNFRQIRPLTTELAALEHLKNQCLPATFSWLFKSFLMLEVLNTDMYDILHEFEFWPYGN